MLPRVLGLEGDQPRQVVDGLHALERAAHGVPVLQVALHEVHVLEPEAAWACCGR